jgi:hypothetical protein
VASFGQTAEKSRALETRPAQLRNLRGEPVAAGYPALTALGRPARVVELILASVTLDLDGAGGYAAARATLEPH